MKQISSTQDSDFVFFYEAPGDYPNEKHDGRLFIFLKEEVERARKRGDSCAEMFKEKINP